MPQIHYKDSLEYKSNFNGRHAIDILYSIIKTNDRDLALLLGCALEAQQLFHDVTYDYRLRDNSAKIYQFHESFAKNYVAENGYASTVSPYNVDDSNSNSEKQQ
jgi:predicted metal-dependent HD superfamily phosphohydrolase